MINYLIKPLYIMLYLVGRKKHMRKASFDVQRSNERLTTVNDFNCKKSRIIGDCFDGLSTKYFSSIHIRSTSAIKSSNSFSRANDLKILTIQRQKELAHKYNFSKSEIEIYGKICMKMKNLNEREKSNFVSMILEKSRFSNY